MDKDAFLRPMLRLTQRAVNDCFGFLDRPELLEMWIVTRRSNKKDSCTTYGYHVHWPNLIVNLETMTNLRSVRILSVKRTTDHICYITNHGAVS